ncbi:MAG: tRNA lysidine(34) synthetase TilS [Epulopiscium sp. Nele67-Bin005]|nr:MAG: tRNA lysidine(34) synthetase TilS [Epulopiscium sp. Nele67-Bin005]
MTTKDLQIKKIEQKVSRFIEEEKLFLPNTHILVAVSGGADSMMLLHYLRNHQYFLKIQLSVAHLNHRIRENSGDDMNFVQQTCNDWEIPFFAKSVDIKKLALENKVSEEECARDERYKFFFSLGADNIATAHNQNDQAETLIMRFLRGSDVRGLAGILPKRNQIIRPVLCLTREEIEYYCKFHQINFCIDETNLLPIYTRNRIRLECIPYIEKYLNPNIVHTLYRHSQLYREEDEFLEGYVKSCYEECVIQTNNAHTIIFKRIVKESIYIQKRVILKSIEKLVGNTKNISSQHIEDIINLANNQSGRKIDLPNNIFVIKSLENIEIYKNKPAPTNIVEICELKEGENFFLNYKIIVEICIISHKTFVQTVENMYTKFIDYDKIKNGLNIRVRQAGDKITLSGGTKKLKKFFIDEKVPLKDRDTTPLIVDGQEVVWVVGSRLSTNYYIQDTTTKMLKISILKRENL